MLDLLCDLKSKYPNKKIYIYGAGMVAYYLAKYILSETEFNIDGFLVSDIDNNPQRIFEIPVFELSKEYKDELIIIGTKENLHNKIHENLLLYGFQFVYMICDGDYYNIRNRYPDMSYETINSLYKLHEKTSLLHKRTVDLHKSDMAIHEHISNNYHLDLRNNGEFVPDGKLELKMSADFAKLFSDEEKYLEKLEGLISNLDVESKETVFQILHRFRLLIDNKPIKFTTEEKEIVKDYLENFYTNKYKISSKWYYYNGYNLPIENYELSVFWHRLGLDKLCYPENIKDKDVIDAGAYVGDSALIISEYTNGTIYGFEAFNENFELMKKTIQMNNLQTLQPVNLGLSNKIETKELIISNSSSCNCFEVNDIYTFNESEKITVQCTTIDMFVKENNLNIGLIKSDIEGGEQMLLEGAVQTIKNQKPTLLISIYHSLEDFFDIKKWIENLNLGYEFKIFRPIMQHHFITETVLIAEVPKK